MSGRLRVARPPGFVELRMPRLLVVGGDLLMNRRDGLQRWLAECAGGALEISRWRKPPDLRPHESRPGRGAGSAALPGRVSFPWLFRWLTPPANFRRASGTKSTARFVVLPGVSSVWWWQAGGEMRGNEMGGGPMIRPPWMVVRLLPYFFFFAAAFFLGAAFFAAFFFAAITRHPLSFRRGGFG